MKADSVWMLLVGMLLFGTGAARADWPQPPDDIQTHVIPVDGSDSAAEVVRMDMDVALAGTQPAGPNKIRQTATSSRGYVLCGNLFGTDGFFALYEPKIANKAGCPTLALAEYVDAGWKLRGLWKIDLYWVPQDTRWSGPESQYDKNDSPNLPFTLEDLISDNTPEVIVSGEKAKYFQARYVMRYDKKSHGLDLLTYSWTAPQKVGDYLRIVDTSGNKAVWCAWTFLEWKDNKLTERAMWHSESPYNNVDPSFFKVRTTGADGKKENFRATMSGAGDYDISKDDKPFAKLSTKWLSGKSEENADLMMGAWIFEKLTGLPREYFPERHGPLDQDKSKLEKLEEFAEVEVVGSEESTRRFSGKK
jgi:hypothetical protein